MVAAPARSDDETSPQTVEEVYERHFDFVWSTLRSLGAPASQLDDAVQDVFLVVQRQLESFEGRARIRTWLFAIARRVASNHRRRARRIAEREPELDRDHPARDGSPRDGAERAEAAAILLGILDRMSADQRAVFVAIELGELTAPEAAEALGVKLNTVYSRLRSARQLFEREVARTREREGVRDD